MDIDKVADDSLPSPPNFGNEMEVENSGIKAEIKCSDAHIMMQINNNTGSLGTLSNVCFEDNHDINFLKVRKENNQTSEKLVKYISYEEGILTSDNLRIQVSGSNGKESAIEENDDIMLYYFSDTTAEWPSDEEPWDDDSWIEEERALNRKKLKREG
ncbi:hypothetical protein G9A89_020889 [Geosiphon pyriformis]|nr:hypothetical protein G9A89_020889 [Geosiphon pyriformis]